MCGERDNASSCTLEDELLIKVMSRILNGMPVRDAMLEVEGFYTYSSLFGGVEYASPDVEAFLKSYVEQKEFRRLHRNQLSQREGVSYQKEVCDIARLRASMGGEYAPKDRASEISHYFWKLEYER